MKLNVFSSYLIIVLASASVGAVESGFYLGSSTAQLNLGLDGASDVEVSSWNHFAGFGANLSDGDSGWKTFAGFQFNQYIGAQVGIRESDAASAAFAAATPRGSTLNEDVEVSEFSGAVTGMYPLNRELGLFAKIGAARWSVDGTATARIGGTDIPVRASQSGTNVLFGLGGRYNFNDRAVLRFEWEHYSDINIHGAGKSGDVDVFGGSLLYRF
jgi:OOP family OmpA-OmpF porin